MGFRPFLFVCVLVGLCYVVAEGGKKGKTSPTRFTCVGKPNGYYADVDTGCQVYHMCDGLGRQFSYKCPNMTLFQQRMLICDHWYMVNCSMSERDYDANLLIGQRDKPFVTDDEMRLRTPRPDILSVPPYNPFFDILREESELPDVDNDLDTRQSQRHFKPPTAWSTGINRRHDTDASFGSSDRRDKATSKDSDTSFRPTVKPKAQSKPIPKVSPPTIELVPPNPPVTQSSLEDSQKDSTKPVEDAHFKFIKRFDPSSPDTPHQTAMSKSEILDLNAHLPDGQTSAEDDRTPRKHKDFGKNANTFQTHNDKSFTEGTRFDSVNTKANPTEETVPKSQSGVPEPARVLLPPKTAYSNILTTTVGPPIYYEWRWAVPAFGLVPPKQGNDTNTTNIHQTRSVAKFEGRNPFATVTRPPAQTETPEPIVSEYNISSYFIPDYVFPLDREHPGYESEDAETSFHVKIASPGKANYGENPECPQCHPAYLKPGTCEPCIVKR